VTYRERSTPVAGAVLWERRVEPGSERARILPDGCLDLIWDGRQLFVAGPDSAARWHVSRSGIRYTALRFSGGVGPALLGVPADALRDRSVELAELWPSREATAFTERVAADPAGALEGWAVDRRRSCRPDPVADRVLVMAASGVSVGAMADRLGISARQLHRRCLASFGYGPRRLGRVLRMVRALDAARAGGSLAGVAAGCGFSDQAHLCRELLELGGTTPVGLLRELGVR
jgi:AraC-like DNA-binding protein